MKLHHSIFPVCMIQSGRLVPCSIFLLFSCSVSKQISKQADNILLKDSTISKGHIGISIYEPSTGKYWYNYNAGNYFIPSSNTKLFTLYAGMKYLGDSLPGMKIAEYENKICLTPTGDPTFLHPDFPVQRIYNFLSSTTKEIWAPSASNYKFKAYGQGWAWDDYNDSYMNERSAMPVFANCIYFSGSKNNISYFPKGVVNQPSFDIYSNNGATGYISKVTRDFYQNKFVLRIDGNTKENIVVPFITSAELAFKLLADTLHKKIVPPNTAPPEDIPGNTYKSYKLHSQPSDSLFKPMMHNSDNFFAEQTLLMVSNERLGYMSDEDIIDTLLKTDLKDIPQRPRWVDGSGLSRYNLFTPLSFVYILEKLKTEFGMDRLKNILPTGGQGTLKNYFQNSSSSVYAKTGTISNNSSLSGYLITKKGKLLIFSVLVNNYPTGATPVRRAIEQFLAGIRENIDIFIGPKATDLPLKVSLNSATFKNHYSLNVLL